MLFSILVRGQDGSKLRHFEANRLLDERKLMLVERAFKKKTIEKFKQEPSLALVWQRSNMLVLLPYYILQLSPRLTSLASD